MITMKGKYNTANIFIDTLEDSAKEQIQSFLNHPAFQKSHIAIMPDVHAGKGAVIGYTQTLNNWVIPNIIGVDIGCGLTSVNIRKTEFDCKDLDIFIKENIPHGFNIRSGVVPIPDTLKRNIKDVCSNIRIDSNRSLHSIGTLGGGNHFLEVGVDSNNDKWLTVHSGSRTFGKNIAEYYQKKCRETLIREYLHDHRELTKDLEYLPMSNRFAQEYVEAMKVAQEYAHMNREAILNHILTDFFRLPNILVFGTVIESVHNYIDFENNIIRKGAISAKQDELVLIPFNMRDGLIIGKGKGNKAYNYSAPHGAGRIMSRKIAKENLKLEDYQKQMEGIYTSTANQSTIDEAPDAYKPMQFILDNIADTVEIVDFIKPIYNFKSGEED